MKMNNLVKTALFATGLTLATTGTAFAAKTHCPTQPKPCGAYMDLLLGYGSYDLNMTNYESSRSAIVGSINAGYQFNKHFALELGTGAYAPRIVGKFILPLDQSPTELYAKAGVGAGIASKTYVFTGKTEYEVKTVATAGVGGTYWLNNRWGVTAEANYSTNFGDSHDGIKVFSILGGTTYHF